MNMPSTNQSTVGTETSKKPTGVRIVGKVPEANKLKVHSAKAENSTKISKSGHSKKYHDQYAHPESEIGDDGQYSDNSHMVDSISKMDSSMNFGGSEYMDNDRSEYGGHKPRSVMSRTQVGGDSKHERIDDVMSMSSKNKYEGKDVGAFPGQMDHDDKHRHGKDSYSKQGDEDEYRNRGSRQQHSQHQYGGPMIQSDSMHMQGMPEQNYKPQDMGRGGDRDRNNNYQQGYLGYQQPTKPLGQKGKVKPNDEAMFVDQKMQRGMYMQTATAMQEPYTPHPYDYMQPMPMHPPNHKHIKGGINYPMGQMHDRPEGYDPMHPSGVIDEYFNAKQGDPRHPNMPIPFSAPGMGGKGTHLDQGSNHKYAPEEIPGGKFGKFGPPTMHEVGHGHFEIASGMIPLAINGVHPISRVDKNGPHTNPYLQGPSSTKGPTSTSSRDGNIHKRIMELEQQIKERESTKSHLAKIEIEAVEERNKAQQELENVQGVLESCTYVDIDNKDCIRCYSIFNLNNTISKTDLNTCLHKEISTFEHTILAINEQEKPMLDGLIKKMEEIISQIFPDSSLHVFGSFSTGLCLPWSDIDILLDAGANPRNYDTDILAKVEDHLGKFPDIVKTRKYVRSATFPVLKIECTSQYKNKKMDITIKENRHSGLQCVELVKEYLSEYQIVLRPFVFVLKQMVYLSGLNDPFTGGINSYGLILMVVSYLQMEFKRGISKEEMASNLGTYFLQFLNYYGNTLNYNMVELRPSKVEDFKTEMPDPFTHRQTLDLQPNQSSLVIQDPLQRSNNVTRSTFAFNIIRVD